jgi:N-acetylglutamate synthase-like GNAT family acetyltransferase
MGMDFAIVTATPKDVAAIADLVRQHAFSEDGTGALIPLNNAEIAALVSEGAFVVAKKDGGVAGCASLVEYDGIAEVRSVVVGAVYRGHGIAGRLIDACVLAAEQKGYMRTFALVNDTAAPTFIRRGFVAVDKPPEKLARDCARCPLQGDRCREHAVVRIAQAF